jgi:radical SAM-linked protein
MAYSSGFNPHPRISYAGAAPTGAASEAEYLEIALAEVVDPAVVQGQLEEALPDGLDVVEVVESPGGALADLLQGSRWLIDLEAAPAVVEAAAATFLAADAVLVQRMTKKGLREFDCRGAVISLTATPRADGARLDLVLRHAEPAVRPDDVLSGLAAAAGLETVGSPLLTRLAQGPLDEATGEVGDPLVR